MSDVLSTFDPGVNSLAEQYYVLTIESLRNDDKLRFDFSMELARSYLEVRAWGKLQPLIDKMHSACKANGTDDPKKADQLIQIYAVRIEQMFATGDMSQLEKIYHLTNKLSANVSEYRSAPILAEFRGKYFSEQRDWGKAYGEFFEAIKKNSDQSRAKLCVKYLVLVTMLGEENADPFASREVKIYETDKTVAPMVSLYKYFLENQIYKLDTLFKKEEQSLCSDSFISKLLPQIAVKLRKKTLVAILRPYQRVKLNWLAGQLYYDSARTEQLLIGMILDGTILARINQV